MMLRGLLVACVLWSLASRGSAQPASQVPSVELTAQGVEIDHAPALSTDLVFEPGDAAIKPAARPLLDAIARAVAKDPATTITIACHTDDTAPDNDRSGGYNQRLSRDRAEAVVGYLVKRGVAARRLVARGYGRDKPIADNASDDGKRMNRRLELSIASEIRPPEPADLAGYTRAFKGRGALIATIATSQGTFHCQLFEDKAPMTVANFVGLATGQKPWIDPRTGKIARNQPFYDGLMFHRVIPHFMIQGGDPLGRGDGGPGYEFGDEVSAELPHKPGALAMANRGPNTNGSQFFIDEIEVASLNNHYTVFGQCKEIDLVARIAGLPRGPGDRPSEPVTIQRIAIARGAP